LNISLSIDDAEFADREKKAGETIPNFDAVMRSSVN